MKLAKLSSEDRKAQVLAAARSLFAKEGYSEVTLDDIPRKVGISWSRIVQLFGSKKNLYEDIAESAYTSHTMDHDLADPISRKDDFAVFETFAAHILIHTTNLARTERSSKSLCTLV